MLKAKILICFIPVLFGIKNLSAQKVWTLEECVDYAYKNNLTIRQRELAVQTAKVNVTESKMATLPSLNASVSNGYNFGRSIDPFTNQFVVQNITNYRFGLSSGVVLFNGFQIYNNVRLQNTLLQASKFDLEVSRNDIGLSLANAYLQVLFANELVKIGENQLASTGEQLQRQKAFFDAGRVAENAVLEMEAQKANDELTLINAQNQLQMAKLTLFQLMDLSPDSNEVYMPSIDSIPDAGIYSGGQLYEMYQQYAPELKAAGERLAAAGYSLKIARGAYYPRLTLGGDISSVFSENYRQVKSSQVVGYYQQYDPNFVPFFVPVTSPTATQVTPFRTQLDQNLGQTLGFSLSIPIFNNYRTAASVKRSRLDLENTRLNLQITENTVKRQVNQAFTEYLAAKAKYEATQKSYNAQLASFEFAKKRFEASLISANDYRIQQNNLQVSGSNLVQAKYELMFRYKIIDFYKHGNVKPESSK